MMHQTAAWDQVRPYLVAFRTHYRLWLVPTLVATVLATGYALVMPRSWRASQAIHVRNEAIGSEHGQGEFDSIDRMKVFQETILEVARHPVVVAAVLRQLGPPAGHSPEVPWPTTDAIESLRGEIALSAPKGSEFGRTEIFFLSVAGESPAEAIRRTRALCDEVDKHLNELRDAKAQSIVRELEKTLQLAQLNLNEATSRLEEMERQVGPDLGELRLMNEVGSGDSNLRSGMNQIKAELRQAESNRESLRQLRELLMTAAKNPDQLLATPSRLLETQVGLRRLKDGLVDAQLRCSLLRGKLNEAHPALQAAIRAESEIRQNMVDEVATALAGVEADLQANEAQTLRLQQQQEDLRKRLDGLAGMRARYSNLVSEVKRRTDIVDSARRELSSAQASSSTAAATSLLTRFQEPAAGDRPVGPGKKTVVLAGMAGGFAFGAGLVFLFMPLGPNGAGRRWNDYVNLGRRATDRLFGRRAADRTGWDTTLAPAAVALGTTGGRRATDPTTLTASAAAVTRREFDKIAPLVAPPPTTVAAVRERRQSRGRRTEDYRPEDHRPEDHRPEGHRTEDRRAVADVRPPVVEKLP